MLQYIIDDFQLEFRIATIGKCMKFFSSKSTFLWLKPYALSYFFLQFIFKNTYDSFENLRILHFQIEMVQANRNKKIINF